LFTLPEPPRTLPLRRIHSTLNHAAFRWARDLVHLKFEQVDEFGMQSVVRVHGSLAGGAPAFLDSDSGRSLLSDLDLIIGGEVPELEVRLLRSHFSEHYQPNVRPALDARVSVKRLDAALMKRAEGPSLKLSMQHNSRSVESYLRPSSRVVYRNPSRVVYPLAIEYSQLRWLETVGRGPIANGVAAYEIAKGCARACGTSLSRTPTRPSVHTFESLRRSARRAMAPLRHAFVPEVHALLCRWLDDPEGILATVATADLRDASTHFGSAVRYRWPSSLLCTRTAALAGSHTGAQ
jgi:hypothetical protein